MWLDIGGQTHRTWGLYQQHPSLANSRDRLKDFEQRNGKLIPEASSLEGGMVESREIGLGEIVNSRTVENCKQDTGGNNRKSVTDFKEFAETEGRWK